MFTYSTISTRSPDMFFLKRCESKCSYHTALQFKMIEKKESRAEHSGDIENMINKSFPKGVSNHSTFLKRFYLFILERGKGRKKKRERNINVWLPLTHPLLGTWHTTQACTLTGNQTGDNLVHRPELNPLCYTSQGSSHSISN